MRTLMINTSMLGMAFLAAAAMPASAAPQYYGSSGGTIRCESNDGRTRECATGGGRVMIERQISGSACIEGRSWGYGRNGIWVSQGCRADFRLLGNGGGNYGGNYGNNNGNNYGNNYGGNGQLVRCESNDGRNRTCPMDTRGGVQLVRKISRSGCIEGQDWGYNRNGVWVTDGCRADFRSGGGNYGGNGSYYGNNHGIGGQVFRCESIDGRTRECAANTRAGVQLVRQISSSACIQGRSWGYGRNGIWVSDGCRADFRSY
ncbi:DUF3011 domain-containing protein [Thermomonas sp.]|uniref:DUF3011 domain-containing protein n=1 Tax=Thermomonas sp. TaxID=1971895 RepID=UPI0024876110|nr:DUF3011 domain-containing protein [Thermomonas sp.]MDI1253235.1 DUF3011 domain-containing protein [Thermomonas sp.]